MTCWRQLTALWVALILAAPVAFGQDGGGGTCWDNDCGSSGGPPYVPPDGWRPYGFAMGAQDPLYHFGYTENSDTADLVGFAAKGNIVIGDYTSDEFQDRVAPFLTPGLPDAKVQAYDTDPSDAALGYNDVGSGDAPRFSGDYNQQDGGGLGAKEDGSPRKFYESSLSDDRFRDVTDSWEDVMNPFTGQLWLEGAFYTNHGFIGLANNYYTWVMGAIVARDDAFAFGNSLIISHDIRLADPEQTQTVNLPMTLQRSRLTRWEECPPAGCPPPQP